MPELPEVETIRKGLEHFLVGHKIELVDVKVPKLFEGDPESVRGGRIKAVRRFGKGLVIDLSNGYSLAIHIKLTGQLIFRDPKTKNEPLSAKVGTIPSKFTHVIFTLDKNSYLYYNDTRRFGWIKVIPTDKVKELPFFKTMGPEPFKDLKLDYFKKVLESSNLAVKPLIMDQKKIGGIGNIYANDALYLAKVDPRRKAKSLSSNEIKKLYEAIHKVMEKGLKYGGSSELNYVNALGQ
ncbi:MAG TPA: DNA-formamidopyrimidine glycosylase family protein, partial [Patescibacteria group bacterium]|nr:DNA-formamidopyrimidine glycosylase family protein [Patescibacteria group bacterium]